MNEQNNLSDLFKPQDISRTIEHAIHVFQGRHESLPELLKEAGSILTRVSKQFTPKQMIMAVGGLAVAAIIVISLTENSNGHSDDDSDGDRNRNQNRNKQ